ncbi:MAG: hypothetical protein PHO08_09775 [Methylococcales bacterium]|nr:hypothetical protein [Methylococcales bacterium]
MILQLISEHQAGIPLWMDALSGNSSDKASFRQTLNTHLGQFREGVGLSLIVADSALYTAKTLQDLGDFPWITRVPETIAGTRKLILAASGDPAGTSLHGGGFKLWRREAALAGGLHPSRTRAC